MMDGMRILMAGASGFLGTPLAERLRAAGHEVIRLVRRPAGAPDEAALGPVARASSTRRVLAGADAVVNLAGAGVGDQRWTARYKQLLRASRVDTTGTLADAIAEPAGRRPARGCCCSASAVGWYGDTGDRAVDEDAPAGDGFLADLCRVWEAAARPAEDAGIRVVLLRTGLPLDARRRPAQAAAAAVQAGRRRPARQRPAVDAVDRRWPTGSARSTFLLDRDDLAGPVNLVGPEPVHQRRVHPGARPGCCTGRRCCRCPASRCSVALGEFADEALRSQRVLPGVLQRAGFACRPSRPSRRPCARRCDHAIEHGGADLAARRLANLRLVSVAAAAPAASAEPPAESDGPHRRPRVVARRTCSWRVVALALAVYVTNGLWRDPAATCSPTTPATRRSSSGCWATACYLLRHGADPFFTDLLNAPLGVNLAANTSITVYAVLFAPLTIPGRAAGQLRRRSSP